MKIELPEYFRPRVVMTLFGVMLCAVAVGFFKCSMFGVDPFQCFAMGSWNKFGSVLSYGTYYMLLSFVFLAVDFFLDRHYIGIATFINLFLTGYVVSLSQTIISRFVPDPSIPVRILFLAVGIIVMCFASSLYMTSDLGVSVYDAIPIVISKRQNKVPFKICRIISDSICVATGTICILLNHGNGVYPGIGTIITAFFMGPLVDFFNRKFAVPLLERQKAKR